MGEGEKGRRQFATIMSPFQRGEIDDYITESARLVCK